MKYLQLLISRQSSTIRRNFSAEPGRVVFVSEGIVVFGVVVFVEVCREEYFFSNSSCFIEPKRTNTGAFVFDIVLGKIGVLRSMDRRGLVPLAVSVPYARKGSLIRTGFVAEISFVDRGL